MNIETVKFDVISEIEIEKEDTIQEEMLENSEPRAILMAKGKKRSHQQQKQPARQGEIQNEKSMKVRLLSQNSFSVARKSRCYAFTL